MALAEMVCVKLYFFLLVFQVTSSIPESTYVFTVATEHTDGYDRYIRSAKYYGIEIHSLGLGNEWKGGDMNGLGGGYKINLLRDAVEPLQSDPNAIVIFTDSYDVVFASDMENILAKFIKTDAYILFGAEHSCWPDKSLKDSYPPVVAKGARFLNSGSFMGYATHIYEILKQPISDTDDDQLYFTNIYLNKILRNEHKIQLDEKSEIFQNLNGALADVKLGIDSATGEGILNNVHFMTNPSIIHGNGPSKIYLNAFANYLAGVFRNKECNLCDDNNIKIEENEYPVLTMAIFVEKAVPFFEEFLDGVLSIDYPKDRINLFIYNNIPYHDKLVNKYFKNFGDEYKTKKLLLSFDNISEIEARKLSVQQAQQKGSEYYFYLDADVRIDESDVLIDLIKLNRSFIAPILVRGDVMWSNFWGALTEKGYYARSHDYLDIVRGNLRGLWNVPYVANCFLVRRKLFNKLTFDHHSFDPDMTMCEYLRNEGIFMYALNTKEYGHLINDEGFDITRARPDFYTLFSNQKDWEQRYIHPQYLDQFKPNFTHKQPCPDVYWFPIGTSKFCQDMIAIMEHFGKWSDGSNSDSRIESGYEAVPTRDIHMNQVGLEKVWLRFLYLYIRPLQELVFTGYYHNPPKSVMNFVVRYKPDEQPYLRPHHDSSTYTINIALNQVGVDYEGGGCRFLRYNCSIKATSMGWTLMHPGRLTHYHEGLITTNGTRYIMVSFIDP